MSYIDQQRSDYLARRQARKDELVQLRAARESAPDIVKSDEMSFGMGRGMDASAEDPNDIQESKLIMHGALGAIEGLGKGLDQFDFLPDFGVGETINKFAGAAKESVWSDMNKTTADALSVPLINQVGEDDWEVNRDASLSNFYATAIHSIGSTVPGLVGGGPAGYAVKKVIKKGGSFLVKRFSSEAKDLAKGGMPIKDAADAVLNKYKLGKYKLGKKGAFDTAADAGGSAAGFGTVVGMMEAGSQAQEVGDILRGYTDSQWNNKSADSNPKVARLFSNEYHNNTDDSLDTPTRIKIARSNVIKRLEGQAFDEMFATAFVTSGVAMPLLGKAVTGKLGKSFLGNTTAATGLEATEEGIQGHEGKRATNIALGLPEEQGTNAAAMTGVVSGSVAGGALSVPGSAVNSVFGADPEADIDTGDRSHIRPGIKKALDDLDVRSADIDKRRSENDELLQIQSKREASATALRERITSVSSALEDHDIGTDNIGSAQSLLKTRIAKAQEGAKDVLASAMSPLEKDQINQPINDMIALQSELAELSALSGTKKSFSALEEKALKESHVARDQREKTATQAAALDNEVTLLGQERDGLAQRLSIEDAVEGVEKSDFNIIEHKGKFFVQNPSGKLVTVHDTYEQAAVAIEQAAVAIQAPRQQNGILTPAQAPDSVPVESKQQPNLDTPTYMRNGVTPSEQVQPTEEVAVDPLSQRIAMLQSFISAQVDVMNNAQTQEEIDQASVKATQAESLLDLFQTVRAQGGTLPDAVEAQHSQNIEAAAVANTPVAVEVEQEDTFDGRIFGEATNTSMADAFGVAAAQQEADHVEANLFENLVKQYPENIAFQQNEVDFLDDLDDDIMGDSVAFSHALRPAGDMLYGDLQVEWVNTDMFAPEFYIEDNGNGFSVFGMNEEGGYSEIDQHSDIDTAARSVLTRGATSVAVAETIGDINDSQNAGQPVGSSVQEGTNAGQVQHSRGSQAESQAAPADEISEAEPVEIEQPAQESVEISESSEEEQLEALMEDVIISYSMMGEQAATHPAFMALNDAELEDRFQALLAAQEVPIPAQLHEAARNAFFGALNDADVWDESLYQAEQGGAEVAVESTEGVVEEASQGFSIDSLSEEVRAVYEALGKAGDRRALFGDSVVGINKGQDGLWNVTLDGITLDSFESRVEASEDLAQYLSNDHLVDVTLNSRKTKTFTPDKASKARINNIIKTQVVADLQITDEIDALIWSEQYKSINKLKAAVLELIQDPQKLMAAPRSLIEIIKRYRRQGGGVTRHARSNRQEALDRFTLGREERGEKMSESADDTDKAMSFVMQKKDGDMLFFLRRSGPKNIIWTTVPTRSIDGEIFLDNRFFYGENAGSGVKNSSIFSDIKTDNGVYSALYTEFLSGDYINTEKLINLYDIADHANGESELIPNPAFGMGLDEVLRFSEVADGVNALRAAIKQGVLEHKHRTFTEFNRDFQSGKLDQYMDGHSWSEVEAGLKRIGDRGTEYFWDHVGRKLADEKSQVGVLGDQGKKESMRVTFGDDRDAALKKLGAVIYRYGNQKVIPELHENKVGRVREILSTDDVIITGKHKVRSGDLIFTVTESREMESGGRIYFDSRMDDKLDDLGATLYSSGGKFLIRGVTEENIEALSGMMNGVRLSVRGNGEAIELSSADKRKITTAISKGSFENEAELPTEEEIAAHKTTLVKRQPSAVVAAIDPHQLRLEELKGAQRDYLVTHRVNDAFKGDTGDVAFSVSKSQSKTPISAAVLDAVISNLPVKWSGGNVELIPLSSAEELPGYIKNHYQKRGQDIADIKGVIHNGKVYLNRQQITSRREAEQVIFHETYGHHGIRMLLNTTDINQGLNKLFVMLGGYKGINELAGKYGITREMSEYMKLYSGETRERRQGLIADEFLAHVAGYETGKIKQKALEILGAIRNWLRNHGFKSLARSMSVTDVAYLLRGARRAVNGSGTFPGNKMKINEEMINLDMQAHKAATSPRKGIAMYSLRSDSGKSGGMSVDAVESKTEDIIYRRLGKKTEYEVVATEADLPSDIRRQAEEDGATGSVEGVFHEGKVYLVADKMSGDLHIEETLLHEAAGHKGGRLLFDNNIKQSYNKLFLMLGSKGVRDVAKRYDIDLDSYIETGKGRLDRGETTVEDYRAFIVDELIAQLSGKKAYETLPVRFKNAVKALWGQFRDWLRIKGYKKSAELTDSDLQYLLKRVRQAAIEGGSVALGDRPAFMTAWHGSPHDLEGFTTGKIGTGVGAQAYGWGMYFAGNKEVGEFYRNQLSEYDPGVFKFGGKEFTTGDYRELIPTIVDSGYSEAAAATAVQAIQEHGGNLEEARDYYSLWVQGGVKRTVGQILDEMELSKSKGKLYQVDLKPSEDEYLLWDKPLSEQGEKVRKALEGLEGHGAWTPEAQAWATKEFPSLFEGGFDASVLSDGQKSMVGQAYQDETGRSPFAGKPREMTGEGLYRDIAVSNRSDRAASLALLAAGIRGIKYLDGSSRGKGDGDYNYVIFNDADVEIEAKFSRKPESTTPGVENITRADLFKKAEREESDDISFSIAMPDGKPMTQGAVNQMMEQVMGRPASKWKVGKFLRGKGINARATSLGMLTRRMVAELAKETHLDSIWDYHKRSQDKEAVRVKRSDKDDRLYKRWVAKAKKEGEASTRFADIIHTSTLYQIDPAKAFELLDDSLKPNSERRIEYQRIRAEYDALPGWHDLYKELRQNFTNKMVDLQDSLTARLTDTVEDEKTLKGLLGELNNQFKVIKRKGPYFPLARFGDHIVIVKEKGDQERIVAAFESDEEVRVAVEDFIKQGYSAGDIEIKKGEQNFFKHATYSGVGSKMIDLLRDSLPDTSADEQHLKQDLLDQMNTVMLSSMPDSSYHKNFMHRKGVKGYSDDAIRAFALTAGRINNNIANVQYDYKLTRDIAEAKKQAKSLPAGDKRYAYDLIGEIDKRHENMQNASFSPISGVAGAAGFTWSIGPSIASALVNISQTPLIAYPLMGAKYGFGRAGKEVMRAMKDWGPNGKYDPELFRDIKHGLKGDELKAIQMLEDMGAISTTNVIELQGAGHEDHLAMAKGGSLSRKAHDAMKFAGAPFHYAEVFNRQVTGLAAYRLARSDKKNPLSHDEAIDAARTMIYDSHFDYSSSNRARAMQGNWLRVITMFKQYSLNMSWMMGRLLRNSFTSNVDAETRSQARKSLMGIMGGYGMFVGTLGMPISGMVTGVVEMLANGMGEEDEEFDAEAWYRNKLTDATGKDWAEVIAHGPARAIFPSIDISSRMSIDLLGMWMPRVDEHAEGRDMARNRIAGLMGPLAANLENVITGAAKVAEGKTWRGIEMMIPKAFKDISKSIRFTQEDITTWKGERVLEEDITFMELFMQAVGFSPRRHGEAYAYRNFLTLQKDAIQEAKTRLVDRWIRAESVEERGNIMQSIESFNLRHPQKRIRITGDTIKRSMRSRKRSAQQTHAGTYLPKSYDYLREEGRFANF